MTDTLYKLTIMTPKEDAIRARNIRDAANRAAAILRHRNRYLKDGDPKHTLLRIDKVEEVEQITYEPVA